MRLASVRIIADDIQKMVDFYEKIMNIQPIWYTPDFAEIKTSSATLAIGSTQTLKLFGADNIIKAGQNKTSIIEFFVENVDSAFDRLSSLITPYIIQFPTNMPWGNRSLLFRDPEGNLINLFTPLTTAAINRLDGKVV